MFAKESKIYKPEVISEMRRNPEAVHKEVMNVPNDKLEKKAECKSVLIDAPTQSGKTRKCFEVMQEKLIAMDGDTLILYITQANSIAGATQVLQRASNDDGFGEFEINLVENFVHDNIDTKTFAIGYWNSRNTVKMLDIVDNYEWDNIMIVIDECDQGNLKGIKERMCFIRAVDRKSPNTNIMVIFVTATIGNLSKNILRIAKDNSKKFSTGLVNRIVNERVVEHQFATPSENYVGASWFVNNPNVWKRLDFDPRSVGASKDDYNISKETEVMKQVKRLSYDSKELTLFVTSTLTADHARISEKLKLNGYNVIVEMNNAAGRQFKVHYISDGMIPGTWNIPFNKINTMADKGELSVIRKSGKKIKTGINSKDDLTMPHILQAALFMNTTADARIEKFASKEEFMKLNVISEKMERPHDYPDEPRVALVAGHMAGRGITFQNPAIDFICTSFCFTDTKDAIARGATNAQRFGRACGMLGDVFARPGRQPVLIATKGIVKAAVANEAAVLAKAQDIPNGTLLSLKDLITEEEWTRIMKNTIEEDDVKKKPDDNKEKIDGVDIAKLKRWINGDSNLIIAKMVRFLYKIDQPITIEEFKTGVDFEKSLEKFESHIRNSSCVTSQYGMMFTKAKDNKKISANPTIVSKLRQLNL